MTSSNDNSIIYGYNPVLEALMGSADIECIYLAVGVKTHTRKEIEELAREKKIKVLRADRRELDRISSGGVHQGVVAVCGKTRYLSLEEISAIEKQPRTLILCLDGIQDPRNLGALARTALALGAAGMIIPAQRAVGITPAAQKTAAGAFTNLPVARVKNMARALEQLKKKGFWVSGAVCEGGQAPWSYDPGNKVALVLGSEGSGMRRGVESHLDYRVFIPTDERMNSLNVSVAGALLMYEFLRK
jgi:23S rRNA (guanosine2251-2'-O)-methyltransferase